MKDRILERYDIPLLRFATNGSAETAQIEQALDGYEKSRQTINRKNGVE
jgi:hypothetical protein